MQTAEQAQERFLLYDIWIYGAHELLLLQAITEDDECWMKSFHHVPSKRVP